MESNVKAILIVILSVFALLAIDGIVLNDKWNFYLMLSISTKYKHIL